MKILKTDKILIAWIIIVLFLIVWPFPDMPDVAEFDYSDKIVHMILFGAVTFLANISMTARGIGRGAAAFVGLIAGAGYAGLAEIIQIFAPGRDCSIYDFYAGAIGAVVALAIIYARKISQGKRSLL